MLVVARANALFDLCCRKLFFYQTLFTLPGDFRPPSCLLPHLLSLHTWGVWVAAVESGHYKCRGEAIESVRFKTRCHLPDWTTSRWKKLKNDQVWRLQGGHLRDLLRSGREDDLQQGLRGGYFIIQVDFSFRCHSFRQNAATADKTLVSWHLI